MFLNKEKLFTGGARVIAVTNLFLNTSCDALINRLTTPTPKPEPTTSYDPDNKIFRFNSTRVDRLGESAWFIMEKDDKVFQATFEFRETIEELDRLGCILTKPKRDHKNESALVQFEDPNCGPFKN
jgi:hypothetical protein